MNHFILLFAVTFPTMNSVAQMTTVCGTIKDFETDKPLADAIILEEATVNGDVIDSLGNFQLNLHGTSKTLKCSFVGYYDLKIKNIPANIDTLKFLNLKMVKNYSLHLIVEFAPDVEPDMKKYRVIKTKIEEEYRIELLGKFFEPKILEQVIEFDLNRPTGEHKIDP